MDESLFEQHYEPDAETEDVVRRYENMINHRSTAFLDEEEFEIIIEHYLRMNNVPKASEAADCASRTYPLSNEIKLRQAHTMLVRGDAYSAMQLLQTLEYININDPDVFFLKARAYLQLGNVKEALRYFDKAAREAFDNAFDYLCDAAWELMDMQDYASALRYLNQACEMAPDDQELLNDIAYCYERLDELEKSEEIYLKYLHAVPFNDNAWYNLGTVYGRQKKYEEAVKAFEFAITTNEENSSAYFNLAMTYMYLQHYAEAIDTFNEFLTKEPEAPYTYCLMGECYEQLGHFEDALSHYEKALGLKNDFAEAYYGIAMAAKALEQRWNAIQAIVNALRLDAENPEYWYEYGQLLMTDEEHRKDAIAAFRKTLEYNPHDTEALANIQELEKILSSANTATNTEN